MARHAGSKRQSLQRPKSLTSVAFHWRAIQIAPNVFAAAPWSSHEGRVGHISLVFRCAPVPRADAGCPIQAVLWLEWDNGCWCAIPVRHSHPTGGNRRITCCGAVHPSVAAADVSFTLPFVIPSEAEGSAVLSARPRPLGRGCQRIVGLRSAQGKGNRRKIKVLSFQRTCGGRDERKHPHHLLCYSKNTRPRNLLGKS
jgi:hypothetical protein